MLASPETLKVGQILRSEYWVLLVLEISKDNVLYSILQSSDENGINMRRSEFIQIQLSEIHKQYIRTLHIESATLCEPEETCN